MIVYGRRPAPRLRVVHYRPCSCGSLADSPGDGFFETTLPHMKTRLLLGRLLLLCLVAPTTGCSTSSLSGKTGFADGSATELRSLPIGSKLYFRNSLSVPARTDRVSLWASPEAPDVRLALQIESAEVDRTINPGTPLLVDNINGPESPSMPSCTITLTLVTSAGQSMKLRATRQTRAKSCAPITIADLGDLMMVVPSPPVPIR